ncbi:MAG: hypothetical protein C0616_04045 [Desulfuromonas sp.]|nr:MAG: hypothetical protein C0616_04045 [Desulfuromonas sp.]
MTHRQTELISSTESSSADGNMLPLLDVAREMTALLNLETLLESLDSHLRQLFPICGWQLFEVDDVSLQLVKESWGDGQEKLSEACHLLTETAVKLQQPELQLPGKGKSDVPGDGSMFAVPFTDSRDQAWVIGLVSDQDTPPLDQGDVAKCVEFCRFLGVALGNARFVATIQRQNITDDLTGLYNARHFGELLDYEMERARRYGNDLSVVFLDLDYFKQVNDQHGHLVGSRLLHEIGLFLKNHMRRVNLAARYGGDEFVILLPSTPKSGATIMAEHLRSALGEALFSAGADLSLKVTASFGIAAFPTDARSKEDLLRKADSAMYHVKANGRDGVHSA